MTLCCWSSKRRVYEVIKNITCKKYHSFGNSFIVLDETQKIIVNEDNKQNYAKRILNSDTGIGADGLIVLTTPGVWKSMEKIRPLTALKHPEKDIDCIFRHFEPDGSESLMCINGLLVSGLFISEILDRPLFTILAATNTSSPQLLCAGFNGDQDIFVEGLHSSRVDHSLAEPSLLMPFTPGIDKITPLELLLRKDDISGADLSSSKIVLSGYLIFSGEPHLVIFTDQINVSSGKTQLTDLFFNATPLNRRSSMGDRLIHNIGMRIQTDFNHLFPMGLNLTFIHLPHENHSSFHRIEYRCFERAINKETLSCGTGALASACVVQALNLAEIAKTPIYPYLYNRYHSDSFYRMAPHTPAQEQWRITGKPELITIPSPN